MEYRELYREPWEEHILPLAAQKLKAFWHYVSTARAMSQLTKESCPIVRISN
jgi:hypothetical protein